MQSKKVFIRPNTASARAIWTKKFNSASCETRDQSLDSALYKAKIVSNCDTISALHRVKHRLSSEAKIKAPLGANNEAITTSLTFPPLLSSAKEVLSCEARTKAPIGATTKLLQLLPNQEH